MKNLKMFAIGLAAMAAMTTGVHAATPQYTGCGEETVNGTCTLDRAVTVASTTNVTSDLVIKTTATNKLTVTGTLTVKEGASLTIDGGNVVLGGTSATIKIEEGASLIVKNGAVDTNAISVSGNGAKIDVDHGTLEVVNNDRGFVVYGSADLTINLDHSTMRVSDNSKNAMNGGVTVNANYSEIYGDNNGMGGLNAIFKLTYSKISATGNGYSGVTLGTGTTVDAHSTISAPGNNKGTDEITPDRTPDKADILLAGNITVDGEITADTIAPLKDLWNNNGNVATPQVTLNDGIIDVKESKTICATTAIGGTCTGTTAKELTFTGAGVVEDGDTATVYGNVDKYEAGSDIKKVVVMFNDDLELTVAGGTDVENKTNGKLLVKSGNDVVVVEKGKTATVGTATTEPEPTNPDTPSAGDGKDPQNPSEPPKTGDNIMAFVGLGIASLAVVGLGTKNLKKQTN